MNRPGTAPPRESRGPREPTGHAGARTPVLRVPAGRPRGTEGARSSRGTQRLRTLRPKPAPLRLLPKQPGSERPVHPVPSHPGPTRPSAPGPQLTARRGPAPAVTMATARPERQPRPRRRGSGAALRSRLQRLQCAASGKPRGVKQNDRNQCVETVTCEVSFHFVNFLKYSLNLFYNLNKM